MRGLKVTVVGPGTPADIAGLKVGDVITSVADEEVAEPRDVVDQLVNLKPGDDVTLSIMRTEGGQAKPQEIIITTTTYPLQLIQPEKDAAGVTSLSYLLSLYSIGDFEADDPASDPGAVDGSTIRDMRHSNWESKVVDENTVEFRWTVSEAELQKFGVTGPIELVKRYRVVPTTEESPDFNYHMEMEVEIHNKSETQQKISYRMDGPNGLPVEGWWYSNKIHPRRFRALGTRDVVMHFEGNRSADFLGGPALLGFIRKNKGSKHDIELMPEGASASLDFIGVDTLYFNAITRPGTLEKPESLKLKSALARPATMIDPADYKKSRRMRLLNTTYQMVSRPVPLSAGSGPLKQSFTVFLGPKQPKILRKYELEGTVVYGWGHVLCSGPPDGLLAALLPRHLRQLWYLHHHADRVGSRLHVPHQPKGGSQCTDDADPGA